MVLPGLVLAVKALGWAQALLFCAIRSVGAVGRGKTCGAPVLARTLGAA